MTGNGKKWSLVSGRSVEDPSPGGFSMELDPGGTLQIIIMQGSTRYWTSGMWDGEIFAMIPEMNSNRAYKISNFFSEKNESYFNYSVINSSIISRPVLDVSGQIKLESWQEDSHEWKLIWYQPSTHRKVYAFCGAFGSCNPVSQNNCECLPGFEARHPEGWKLLDRSGGCVRKAELQCGNHSAANGDEDRFLRVSKVKLPMYPLRLQIRSAEECQSICLNNCSCSAYTYENEHCKIWNGDLLSVEQLSDEDTSGSHFYLKVAASELHTGVSRKKKWVWIIVALAISLMMVTSGCVIYGIWRRKLLEKGEDLLQFDFGNSSGATNCQLQEANKSGRGQRKEVELP